MPPCISYFNVKRHFKRKKRLIFFDFFVPRGSVLFGISNLPQTPTLNLTQGSMGEKLTKMRNIFDFSFLCGMYSKIEETHVGVDRMVIFYLFRVHIFTYYRPISRCHLFTLFSMGKHTAWLISLNSTLCYSFLSVPKSRAKYQADRASFTHSCYRAL